jgi:hypothetical protein
MAFDILLEPYFSYDMPVHFTLIFKLYYKLKLFISPVKVMSNMRTSHFNLLQNPHYCYLGSKHNGSQSVVNILGPREKSLIHPGIECKLTGRPAANLLPTLTEVSS